jgi:hypothetical protein
MFPLLGFSFRVFCVFRGLSSAPRESLRTAGTAVPTLRLAKGIKKRRGYCPRRR